MPLFLREIYAWITVDGVQVDQQNVHISQDGKEATCGIAYQAGKRFSVKWRDVSKSRTEAMVAKLVLDGVKCGGRIMYPPNHPKYKASTYRKNYVSTSSTSTRPLSFAPALVDTVHESCSEDLKQIKLELWRTRVLQDSRSERSILKDPLSGNDKRHVDSNRTQTYHIKLGNETKRPKRLNPKCEHIDDEPYVTFNFNYSPMDVLNTNSVSSPNPNPKRKRMKSNLSTSERVDAVDKQTCPDTEKRAKVTG